MDNEEILKVAMKQSAIDCNCKPEDFCASKNIIVISENNKGSRAYLDLPLYCNLVSYGNNIVASVNKEISNIVKEYINRFPLEHCFETPNVYILNDELQKRGMKICFMAEYFLPDMQKIIPLICEYSTKVLNQNDFQSLYISQWSNALCYKRKHLDVLGIGAYDNGRLIGLAACSADCDEMWQIGVDVLPEYRKKGIASALTSQLAIEIIKRGKVPFYCSAWANVKSVRNAIKSGFRPAWVEITAKSISFISEINE